MKIGIKNTSNLDVRTTFKGREYFIPAKKSIIVGNNDDEVQTYLIQTFGFLKIVPVKGVPQFKPEAPKKSIKARGKRTVSKKKK